MAEKSKDGIDEDTSEKLVDQDDLVDYECDLTLEMNKELSIYLRVFLGYIQIRAPPRTNVGRATSTKLRENLTILGTVCQFVILKYKCFNFYKYFFLKG